MRRIPFVIAGAAIRAYCKHRQESMRRNGGPPSRRPRWSNSITVQRPLREVRAHVEAHLSNRGFVLVEKEHKTTFYQRGDCGISHLPCDRDVRWHEVPVVLAVVTERRRGKTEVGLCFGGWPATRYAESVGPFFNEHAEMEIDGLVDSLNGVSATPASGSAQPDTELNDDLALLGLTRAFTWDQLQTAYRAACRKFHPDRLVGVPSDVVELAQAHFVKVQAAYERLRERSQQPC